MTTIDYAESIMYIKQLRKKAHDAALNCRWSEVCDIADEIIETGKKLKLFCLHEMEKEICFQRGSIPPPPPPPTTTK
jgi:hypothetical protein